MPTTQTTRPTPHETRESLSTPGHRTTSAEPPPFLDPWAAIDLPAARERDAVPAGTFH